MSSSARSRVMVGTIGLGYALVAMVVGGMLYLSLTPLRLGWFFYIYPSGAGPGWTYPAILAGGPHFFLDLPLLSGILMTLSAAGIGLGMSVGVLLAIRLLRRPRETVPGPTVAGSIAGLTPVVFGLVTLGACCSTAAAATAGIGLVAQSSGTSPSEAIANAWYLGVFQVVVVYVALLAQEQLLRVYESAVRNPTVEPKVSDPLRHELRRPDWRRVGSIFLRVALVVAGVTWSLAALTIGFGTSPGAFRAAVWVGVLFQHEVPGIFAVLVALFPTELRKLFARLHASVGGRFVRVTLMVSGVALLGWIPPPWGTNGAGGLGNELLGYFGFSSGWGAVAPPDMGTVGLLLRWVFQFALLGLLSVIAGISPRTILGPRTSEGVMSTPTPHPAGWREPPDTPSDGG